MLAGVNCTGLVHAVNLEPYMLQSNFLIPTPLSSLPPVSLAENSKVTELEDVLLPGIIDLLLPSIAENIDVEGDSVSTIQLNDEGAEALFPALSSDNILSVWMPSVRLLVWTGLVQVVKLELSILHSECSTPTPLSILENKKIIELEDVLPPALMTLLLQSVAESRVVAGGDVSTVQLNNAGVVLILPTLSCAMTMNV